MEQDSAPTAIETVLRDKYARLDEENTQLHAAVLQLRDRETRLVKLVNDIDPGITGIDADGTVIRNDTQPTSDE